MFQDSRAIKSYLVLTLKNRQPDKQQGQHKWQEGPHNQDDLCEEYMKYWSQKDGNNTYEIFDARSIKRFINQAQG